MSEWEGIVGAPTADGIEIIPRPEAARWDAKRGSKSRKRNRGLGTVYRRDDGPWYWVQYSVRGRQCREPANTTDEQAARDFLRDRLAEAERGAPLSRGKVTLAQLAEMVIQDYENNDRKSTARVRCHFRHLQDFFGGDALAVRRFPFTAHPRLAAIIREQRERTSAVERKTGRLCPWVFHRDGHQVAWFYDGWHTACTKAGVLGRLFHDLRRSAVRNLTRAGINESVAMKISGHETTSVFKRYDIISNADVTDAVRKLAGLGKVIPIRGATRKGRKASR